MIAALPMYDRPETAAAHDALWALVRDGLRARGLAAPDALDRALDYREGWARPDLILGQVCNLPFRAGLRGRVTVIGAADHGLPGDPPGFYHSVIVARADDDRPASALAHCFAVNDALSNSGWDNAVHWARAAGVTLRPVVVTGSHEGSVRAVASGEADLAAIDAVSWEGFRRWTPAARTLRVLGRTRTSPGMTFITRQGEDPAPYREALAAAIAALPGGPAALLGLRGVVVLPPSAYDLPLPPDPAAFLG